MITLRVIIIGFVFAIWSTTSLGDETSVVSVDSSEAVLQATGEAAKLQQELAKRELVIAVEAIIPIAADEEPPKDYLAAVQWHRKRYDALNSGLRDALKRKLLAQQSNSFDQLNSAIQDVDNAYNLLAPYAVAQMQAELLKASGKKFRLRDPQAEGMVSTSGAASRVPAGASDVISVATAAPVGEVVGEVCNGGQCAEVDPLIALFLIAGSEIVDVLNDPKKKEALEYFLAHPLGGPNSEFMKVRNAILGTSNNEIVELLRNPVKRPVEILKNWRDSALPKESGNDIVKAVRNPLKCTVGKLFGKC